jgi:choline dehydrogenase-like flavoprotein
MLKLVGGTTWHWGGACWRNLPNDFKLKSTYGVGRDWPIGYEDLEPWYHQAEIRMGVSGDDHADYSGKGGAPYPPRKEPFPIRPQELSYFSRRFAERVKPGGYNYTYQPNGRATVPMRNARPAWATTIARRSVRSARNIQATAMSPSPNAQVPN